MRIRTKVVSMVAVALATGAGWGSVSVAAARAAAPAPALTAGTIVTVSTLPPLDLGPGPMAPDVLAPPVANTPVPFRWVGMGDSFASGEGDPVHGINKPSQISNFTGLSWGSDSSMFVPYKTATNYQRDLFTCHRSDRAGAPQANAQLKTLYPEVQFAFGFVACSGAKTTALVNNGYTGPTTIAASRGGLDAVSQPSQIDRAKSFAGSNTLDALYFSAGGNDAGFGDLISACLDPFSIFGCAHDWGSAGGLLQQHTDALPADYAAVETKLQTTFGSHMPAVLISDYPNPIDDGVVNPGLIEPVCYREDYDRHGETGVGGYDDMLRSNIDSGEADFAFGAAGEINSQVDAAAALNSWILVDTHLAATQGHGMCATNPFFNLNSKALHTQGEDLPQGPFGVLPFSAGLLHPNDKGFTAYANAIVLKMRRLVDTKLLAGLHAPQRVRIAAAQNGDMITVHWDDKASTENAFDVEVVPVDQQAILHMTYPANVIHLANGGFVQRVTGSNTEVFNHFPNSKGLFRYRVRACNTHISTKTPQTTPSCGSYSAPTTGANFFPATVTGLNFTSGTVRVGKGTVPAWILNWTAQPESLEYVVRTLPPGAPSIDTRLTGTALNLGTKVTAQAKQYQVASCNRVGCSLFTLPKLSPP